MGARLTHEDFLNSLMTKNITAFNELTFLQEYKNNRTKILAIDRFGLISACPKGLLSGKITNIDSAVDKTKYLLENVKYRYPNLLDGLTCISSYKGTNEPLYFVSKYGVVKITPMSLLSGCAPMILSAIDKPSYFIELCKEKFGLEKFSYDKAIYESNYKPVIVFCNNCGNYFSITPNSLLGYYKKGYKKYDCVACNMSKGERKVSDKLKENKIYYVYQYCDIECKHKNPLRFDFYLPDYNLIIEYDGELHYEKANIFGNNKEVRLLRDKIKDDYCLKNNINMLRIPYIEYGDIDKKIDDEIERIANYGSC